MAESMERTVERMLEEPDNSTLRKWLDELE
jgi:hypothetical protein